MPAQKLNREQLNALINRQHPSARSANRGGQTTNSRNQDGSVWNEHSVNGFLPPYLGKIWHKINQQINGWIYQKRVENLLNSFMLQVRHYLNEPSRETMESFTGSKADLKAFIVEHLWQHRFRDFWLDDGENLFFELSRRITPKIIPARRHGDYLVLQSLLEAVATENEFKTTQNIWYQENLEDKSASNKVVEISGRLDYDRLIGIKDN